MRFREKATAKVTDTGQIQRVIEFEMCDNW